MQKQREQPQPGGRREVAPPACDYVSWETQPEGAPCPPAGPAPAPDPKLDKILAKFDAFKKTYTENEPQPQPEVQPQALSEAAEILRTHLDRRASKVARAEAKQDAKNMAARADGAGAGSGWRSALQGALDDIGVVGGSPSPGKGAAKLHAMKAALKARRHPPTPRMYMSHHIIYVTPHYICHTQSCKFTPRALRALSQHSRPCYTPNPAPKR